MNGYKLLVASAILTIAPSQVNAQSKADIKMLKGGADCVYVVQVAEQNGVRLNNSAATWADLVSQAGQKMGVDTSAYIKEARAKYNARSRKMGAEDTLRKMISNARECDKGLN